MSSNADSRNTRPSLNEAPLDIENLPSRILNGDCKVLPPTFRPPEYVQKPMFPYPSCGPCGVPPPCFFPPPCTPFCPPGWICQPPPCCPLPCFPKPSCPTPCCSPKPCCCSPPPPKCCPPSPPCSPKCCPPRPMKCPPPPCIKCCSPCGMSSGCCCGPKKIVCIPKRKTGNGESTSRANKNKSSAANPSFDQPASYNNCNFYLTTVPKGLQDKFGMMMGQGSIASEDDCAEEVSVDDCEELNQDDEECTEDDLNAAGGDDRVFHPPVGYPNSERTPWATGGVAGETNSGGRGGSNNSGGGIRGGRGSFKSGSSNSRNVRRNVIPDDCDDQQYTGAGAAGGGGGGYNSSAGGGGYNNSAGRGGGGYYNSAAGGGGGYNNSAGGGGVGYNNSAGGGGGYNNSAIGGGYNSYNQTSGDPNRDIVWGDDPCLNDRVYRNPENYRDYLYDDEELTTKPEAYRPENYPVPPPHTFNKKIHPLRAPILPPSGMATPAKNQKGIQNYNRGLPNSAAYDNCEEETGIQYGRSGTRAPQTSANYQTYYGGQYDDNCSEIPRNATNARSNYVKRGYSAPDLSQNDDRKDTQQIFKANTFAHLPTKTPSAFNPQEDCAEVDAAECEELIAFKNDITDGKTKKKRNKKFCIRPHARRLRRLCSVSNRRSQRLSDVHKPMLNMAPPPCPIRETVASILKKKPPIDCRWHDKEIPPFHEFCMTDHCPDTNRYPLLTRMDCDGLPTTIDAERGRQQVEKRGAKRRNHHRY